MIIKKNISILLTVSILLLSLMGCADNKATSQNQSSKSSTTSSEKPKIYKPKTKAEGISLESNGYDLIERPQPEKITDMSKNDLKNCVEKVYEIQLPETVSFEPGGIIDFNYKVTDKYYYNYTTFGVYFTKVVSYFTEEDVNFLKHQISDYKNGWNECTFDEYFLNPFKEENIKEIVGDYSNKEYMIYVNDEDPMITVNHTINRYIFFMKDEDTDKYIVIFDGEANNYGLRDGTISIQNDGSGKVITKQAS